VPSRFFTFPRPGEGPWWPKPAPQTRRPNVFRSVGSLGVGPNHRPSPQPLPLEQSWPELQPRRAAAPRRAALRAGARSSQQHGSSSQCGRGSARGAASQRHESSSQCGRRSARGAAGCSRRGDPRHAGRPRLRPAGWLLGAAPAGAGPAGGLLARARAPGPVQRLLPRRGHQDPVGRRREGRHAAARLQRRRASGTRRSDCDPPGRPAREADHAGGVRHQPPSDRFFVALAGGTCPRHAVWHGGLRAAGQQVQRRAGVLAGLLWLRPEQHHLDERQGSERTKRTIMGPTTLAVMMSPWEGGKTLQRAWCCLEIALHALVGHDIVIVLTPAEKERFLDAFRKDFHSIMNNTCTVDVLKAEATKKEDKEWVVKEMQAVEGGVPKINQMIISSIFAALTQVARSAVESAGGDKDAEVAMLCNNLARLLKARGQYEGPRAAAPRRGHLVQQPGPAPPGPGPVRRGGRGAHAAGPGHRREGPRAAAPRRGHLVQQPGHGPPGPGNLVQLLQDRGQCGAETEGLMRRALAIGEKALGPQHPAVATRCNNLARLLQDQGQYGAETEGLMRRALAISEKALGPQHPDVAIRCNNLARLLQDRGQYGAETEGLMRRALAIGEKALGPQHPAVATYSNNLAALLRARGQCGVQ
ncbi:unnamed protein product, partial [Prorocentrum cordatum]